MAIADVAPRVVTAEEQSAVQALVSRARSAMQEVEDYGQDAVDRLCRAVAWAGGNEATATRLRRRLQEKVAEGLALGGQAGGGSR